MAEHKKEAKSGSFSKNHPHAYDFLMLTGAVTTAIVLGYLATTYVAPKVMAALGSSAPVKTA